jgi:TRAP-type mannitol/chloroaromatic compound transport system permease small subunit
MTVQKFLLVIDEISTWCGKVAAWLIILLMAVVCVEVFKRYIMNMPTAWIFDLNSMLYGSAFMLCGAYTLAQNAHVRGDFLYSSMRPRMQASLDIVLYAPPSYTRALTTLPTRGGSRSIRTSRQRARRSITSNP